MRIPLFFLFFLCHFYGVKTYKYPEEGKHHPDSVTKETILANYDKFRPKEEVNVLRETLVFVTPWNPVGYHRAIASAKSISIVSPVWFQIDHSKNSEDVEVTGMNHIDKSFIKKLRKQNPAIQIVPRIYFPVWNKRELKKLYSETKSSEIGEHIADFCITNRLNGALFDFTAVLQSIPVEERIFFIEGLGQMSKALRKRNLMAILSIPAPVQSKQDPLVSSEHLAAVIDSVDFIQVCTYDYYGLTVDGLYGISPLFWIQQNIDYLYDFKHKLLIGLNFYGYKRDDKKLTPIHGLEYIKFVKNDNYTLHFEPKTMEHVLVNEITESLPVYYPSLSSLELRIMLADRYGLGIAIWDYGQGLDYFGNLI